MLLTPHWVFDDYTAVTPDFLRAHGVTLLLTDLDYTLAPKSVREPDDAVRVWLAALAAAGVTVAVLSNNRSPRRVHRRFLGLPATGLHLRLPHLGQTQPPGKRSRISPSSHDASSPYLATQDRRSPSPPSAAATIRALMLVMPPSPSRRPRPAAPIVRRGRDTN